MADSYVCWKCGAPIGHLPFPLGRMSKCEQCKADLHVCKLCKFYDRARANQCQETVADAVVDKQRANFCGYFQPKADAFQLQDSTAANDAQQELSALFGGSVDIPNSSNDPDSVKSELEKLFDKDDADKDKSDN